MIIFEQYLYFWSLNEKLNFSVTADVTFELNCFWILQNMFELRLVDTLL